MKKNRRDLCLQFVDDKQMISLRITTIHSSRKWYTAAVFREQFDANSLEVGT
jgi:hypothetical protein